MKIGMISSNFIKLPPEPDEIPKGFSGAAEGICWSLTEGLVKRGHDVTLFCSGDSETNAKKISVYPTARGLDSKSSINHIDFEYWLISESINWAKKNKPDIIHSHIPMRTAVFARHFPCPIIATLHSPINADQRFNKLPFENNQYYVSISNHQRKPMPKANFIKTIYHGIDTKKILFSEDKIQNQFVFSGRIVPGKGLHTALDIANDLNVPIIVFGECPAENEDYFNTQIKSKITDNVQIEGFVDKKIIQKAIMKSRALLFPIEIPESFGLVLIEAMACGTPVIAYNSGSVSEVIVNNKTGFIIKPGDYRNFKSAAQKILTMPDRKYQKMREECRKHVEKNFSIDKMISNYEQTYKQIIKLEA